MLTNFATIRKSIKKLNSIEKMLKDGSADSLTKKERLVLTREKEKLSKILGGISQLNRLPSAIFMVDISHEHIALKEAKRLGIPTFGMVDTNSDPTSVDFAVPANDDATKSIAIIVNYISDAIKEGLADRVTMKDQDDADAETEAENDRIAGLEEGGEKPAKDKKQMTRRKPTGPPRGGAGAPRR
jgi:small subunit ribosomal protein S2